MERVVIFVCAQMQFQSVECYICVVIFITFLKKYIIFSVCLFFVLYFLHCVCIVFCIVSAFVLSFSYFYTNLLTSATGGNPIAVNKYHIIS